MNTIINLLCSDMKYRLEQGLYLIFLYDVQALFVQIYDQETP